uniref:Pre-mRNA splicing factor component Cdc5p/Cef1 C-terminal domain-containing protein n=1 Tax=Asterionellopsis glacialis TaxID=33640 RepID=A0A7S0PSY6_9STRA
MAAAAAANHPSSHSANSATGALVGDYSDRPLPTPMRTPMTSNNISNTHEGILREASNLRILETGQTPLLGGENPDLVVDGTTTVTKKEENDEFSTVNAATPMVAMGRQTPLSVAPRDELGLNRPKSELRGGADDSLSIAGNGGGASVGGSTFATSVHTMSLKELAREERRAAKRARIELEEALAALPAPQFEYDLAVPDDTPQDKEEMNVETVSMEDDAADLDAAQRLQQKQEAERLYEARSSVMKRSAELPRPVGSVLVPDSFYEGSGMQESTTTAMAERLLLDEMITLMRHDAFAFPMAIPDIDDHQGSSSSSSGKKKKNKRKKSLEEKEEELQPQLIPQETPLDYLPEKSLDSAKDMIQTEMKQLMQDKIAQVRSTKSPMIKNESDAMLYLSNENVQASTQGASSKTLALEKEFECLQRATATLRKKNDKLESKLGVKNGGYTKRSTTLQTQILDDFAQYQNSTIEQHVFQNLAWHEQQGASMRMDRLKEDLEQLESMEAQEQKQYGDLVLEKKRLLLKLKNTKGTSTTI